MGNVQGLVKQNQGHLKCGNPKKPGAGRDHQSDWDGECVANSISGRIHFDFDLPSNHW